MARIPLSELRYLISHQDPKATILFVEGLRDTIFFRRLVPVSDRINSSVIPISEIEIPMEIEGGNRGRLIWLAENLSEDVSVLARVKYLLDADLDRFLGRVHENNIILTDYSDLESYIFNDCSMEYVLDVVGQEGVTAQALMEALVRICKPLKAIRISCVTCGMDLPVNATLGGEGRARFHRYVEGRGMASSLNMDRALNAFHANAESSAEDRQRFSEEVAKEGMHGLDSRHWCQGKDLLSAIASIFNINFSEASRLLMGALYACIDVIREMPLIKSADEFLRA